MPDVEPDIMEISPTTILVVVGIAVAAVILFTSFGSKDYYEKSLIDNPPFGKDRFYRRKPRDMLGNVPED